MPYSGPLHVLALIIMATAFVLSLTQMLIVVSLYVMMSIRRPLARNGNFFKNAVIQKKIAVTSKTIQLHIFSRSLD